MAESRNAPCPCGSGKKYKHCCLGKANPALKKRHRIILIIVVLAALAATVTMAILSTAQNAIFTAILGAMVIGAYLAFRDPPQSRGRKGSDSINFGR